MSTYHSSTATRRTAARMKPSPSGRGQVSAGDSPWRGDGAAYGLPPSARMKPSPFGRGQGEGAARVPGAKRSVAPAAYRLPPSARMKPSPFGRGQGEGAARRLPQSVYGLPPSARRGVLLLVVLILLVMFVMMAVTYVLVASKQLSNNRALARSESTGDPPAQQLDGAMMQVFRGSKNQHSVLYPHSLLEHLYGPYTAVGTVQSSNINNYINGQIVEFGNASLTTSDPNFSLSSSLLGVEGYLEGCVITMTSGPAKGLTSRIIRYDATDPANPIYHVLAFKGASGIVTPAENDPTNNVTFIINGRAFSGTGFGFNSTSGVIDATDGFGRQFAFLPNPVAYQPTGAYAASASFPNGIPFGGLGGANSDYDAPDYQHMAMSWTVMNAATGQAQTILPSFHRPDLINYWATRAAITDWHNDPDLLRKILLRPNPIDHPNFTGSNSKWTASNLVSQGWQLAMTGRDSAGNFVSPWDVDNDGDGVADSVWIDAGYPVQVSTDGKMYKPLFAILCVDLDGRLNVNAAGTTEQLARFDATTGQDQKVGAGPYAGGNQQPSLPRGIGIGPADDSILQFYSSLLPQYGVSSSTAWTSAISASTALMQGGTINSVPYDGRYGDHTSTSNPSNAAPLAGAPGRQSLLGEVMRFQYPDNSFNPLSNAIFPLSSFGTPADLWGRMAIGLDFRGQPLYWKPGWTNEALNSPYDINLNTGGSYQANSSQSDDNPFGAMELERLLRQFDVDSAGLPRRLWDLSGAGPLMNNPALLNLNQAQAQTVAAGLGHTVTTDSWDAPSPGVVAPEYLRTYLSQLYGRQFATNIVELLAARIQKDNPLWTPAQVNAVVNTEGRKLLSPELIAGLRMNINRPLGDGRDGDNNKVVDEPTISELGTEGRNAAVNQWSWLLGQPALANAGFSAPPALDLACGIDVNGDGVVDMKDQLLARQLFARHLYVLARLMIDDDALNHVAWFSSEFNDQNDPAVAGSHNKRYELAVRRIAQWAINVVDNMDPDNIMTPFEFDKDPFKDNSGSGRVWEVDGIIDTNSSVPGYTGDDNQSWRGLVWGCEQPSLLITETFALHDRRVADTDKDPSGKNRSQTPNPDSDLDQVRIPQGSLFVELYATHNPNNPTASGDLYFSPTNTSPWYLNLGAMAPPGNDGISASAQYPVWRLAISKPQQGSGAITSPRDLAQSNPASTSFETEQYVGDPAKNGSLVASVSNIEVDRYVWFTAQNPTAASARDADRIYYARAYNNSYVNNTSLIPAGGYVVVGPRDVTTVGSLNSSTAGDATLNPTGQNWGVPSNEKISLSQMANASNGITTVNAAGQAVGSYPDTTTQIQKPVTIVAGANLPTAWVTTDPTTDPTLAPTGIGFHVTEPLPNDNYYTKPTNLNPATGQKDAYDNLQSPNGTFLDHPFEGHSSTGAELRPNAPVSLLPNGAKTGTTMNYRTVFLQRLANPLVAYHPLTNPYLTVDWMPVDLTVFNGEDRKPSGWDDSKGPWDPDDVNKNGFDNYNDQDKSMAFSSRQRGQFSTSISPTPTYTKFNLWSQWPDPNIKTTTATPTAPNLFNLGGEDPALNLREDRNLGKVNFRFNLNDTTTAVDSGTAANAGVGNASLGFLNHSYGPPSISAQVNGNTAYIGDPQKPFPWLTWNNRPYANIAELMLVPASSPGRLLNEFGCNWFGANVYLSNDGANKQLQSYPHLLNFFSSAQPKNAATNPDPASTGHVGLSQMFEYLQVPSPFVGTQHALNPINFAGDWWMASGAKPGELSGGTEPVGTAGLHPPFNFVSNYRDPGKVNVNTLVGEFDSSGTLKGAVWNAIVGGDPATSPTTIGATFRDVALSRQGYTPVGATTDRAALYAFDSAHPSIFSRPFRSGAAADMAPLDSLKQSAAEATVFRGADANSNVPMLMGTFPKNSYNDGTRNPYFTFQGLENITGKLTTRSNVYAVWITVGYFEVTPWYGSAGATSGAQVFDTAHPDGYQLGQEVGADSGQVQRHRAFYIIDRSIPVGFQRGYDNNDNNAVILKRFIE
jgi:hypothetical protein